MNFRHSLAVVVGAASVLPLSGCPSFLSLQTARALDRGQLEITGATSVVGITDNGTQAKEGGVSPSFMLAARYGVADGFDVGLKIEPVLGFIATGTVQLHHGTLFDLALAPDVGYFRFPGPMQVGTTQSVEGLSTLPTYAVIPIDVPLLIGVNLANDHQIVFGPRLSGWTSIPEGVNDPSGTITATTGGLELFAGGALGVSFRVAKTVRIMPEVDVMVPIAWTGAGQSACGEWSCAPAPTGGVLWQFAIGIATGIGGGEGYL